jgi:hypothetical protein
MGARLAWNNLLTVQGVVITSSSEAVGFTDDNLANPARWKKWRSGTATTDQWVKFDLGSNLSLQCFAAINAEYTQAAGATLRVQANATDSWGSPTIDDLLVKPSPDFTRVQTDWRAVPSSLRWVRFYFVNPGAMMTYFELGAVFAGTYLEPARTVKSTLSVRRIDPSVQLYAVGGQRTSVIRQKFHQVSGAFALQTATARNDLRALYESTGWTYPAILAVDPNNPSLIFYGSLGGSMEAQHRGSNLWDVPIEFTEDVA